MGRIILLMLVSFMGYSQTITVSGTTYQLSQEMMDMPETYLYDFLQVARDNYGIDYFSERGSISFYSGRGYQGGSVNSCAPGYRIELQTEYWNRATPKQKRDLMFHELGHGIMNLSHICHSYPYEPPSVYRNYPRSVLVAWDIMWSVRRCSNPYQPIHLDREDAERRMFDVSLQNHLNCGGSSKADTNYKCVF